MRQTLRQAAFLLVPILFLGTAACDDPLDGPCGGVIFVIRTFPAVSTSPAAEVESVRITYDLVEAVWTDTSGSEGHVVLDSQTRTIELRNEEEDVFVAQLQVPVGDLKQLRIYGSSVEVRLTDGRLFFADRPSWDNSGWKVVPEDGTPFVIELDELSGVRGLFHFDDRLVEMGHGAWLIKPTLAAEAYDANPLSGEPGVFLDQLTVVFKPGTTPSEIDDLNDEIGASIRRAPVASYAYRIKLPSSINLQDAFAFYNSRSEVQGIMPATNYGTLQVDYDGEEQPAQTIAKLPDAWEFMLDETGSVGDRNIRIGVIDYGVKLDHPEIYLNIAINQGELPVAVFDIDDNLVVDQTDIDFYDTDGDGLITFVDLNDPNFAAALPVNTNNTYIDGKDILASWPFGWSNGIDEDGNGYDDDLVGWDFEGVGKGDNDPSPVEDLLGAYKHGTFVSQVIAAVGDNGIGLAGTAWHVSIVPIRAEAVSRVDDDTFVAMPDVAFLDGATYLEDLGVDIINVSQGYHFVSENADLSDVITKLQMTPDVPQDDFDADIEPGQDAFRVPPWYDPATETVTSQALYTFGAGNSRADIGDPNVLLLPSEFMKAVIPDNVVIVGAAETRTSNRSDSGYGTAVDLWAPGNWVLLSYDGDFAVSKHGTSYASGVVAGVAALVLSRLPRYIGEPALLQEERLLDTADHIVDVEVGDTTVQENQPLLDALDAVSRP